MRATIVPLLAVAAGLSYAEACDAFQKARLVALARNRGRNDTRTFMLTIEGFRAAHPFPLSKLQAAREAAGDAMSANAPI